MWQRQMGFHFHIGFLSVLAAHLHSRENTNWNAFGASKDVAHLTYLTAHSWLYVSLPYKEQTEFYSTLNSFLLFSFLVGNQKIHLKCYEWDVKTLPRESCERKWKIIWNVVWILFAFHLHLPLFLHWHLLFLSLLVFEGKEI